MSWPGAYIYMPVEPALRYQQIPNGAGASRVREKPHPETPPPHPVEPASSPRTPESYIDRQLVGAALALQLTEARVIAKEAALLARLVDTRGFEKLGFSSLGDLAREVLHIDPRTARNRVALARILAERPLVRDAYLAGAVSTCQVLVLRPVLDLENQADWLRRCASLNVRDLAKAVRHARNHIPPGGDTAEEDPGELPDMRSISFSVPPSVQVAWDLALETARMSIGWDAPVYRCVEAILAEASPGSCPETPLGPEPPSLPAWRKRRVRLAAAANALHRPDPRFPDFVAVDPCCRALQTLRHISEFMDHVHDLIDEVPSGDAHILLDRIRALQPLDRAMRVLLACLVRDLINTRAVYRLGFLRVSDFLEERLHVSERHARDLVHESDVFAECPALETAWRSGRIGIRQALVIHRIAPLALVPDFIKRAESVTLRQFVREMRIVEKLQDLGMHRLASPLPHAQIEAIIVRQLKRLGWFEERLASALTRCGVVQAKQGKATTDQEPDPARNSTLMRRLEVLVDLLLLSTFENAVERWDDLAIMTPDRQMFSAAAELADTDGRRAGASHMKVIRFVAPEPIARHWRGAIRDMQAQHGPRVPVWMSVLKLLRDAVETWYRHDPDTVPTMKRILERDGYLCQVPGCSNRRNLEVHHVHYRSRGGGDNGENLITLCHTHHRHGIHKGYIRVTGVAPHDLTWDLGARKRGLPPTMKLRGEGISVT